MRILRPCGRRPPGFAPQQAAHALEQPRRHRAVRGITLMTHFANADEARGITGPLALFDDFAAPHRIARSLANSAALLRYPEHAWRLGAPRPHAVRRIAVFFKEHASKAGIDINVVREPNDGYWDNVWMKKGWCASYWNGRPTCDWMFTTAYAADAAWNDTAWKNDRFNQLLVASRSETDSKTRQANYAEMQQLLHDDGGVIVLCFNNYVGAYSNKLDHGEVASNWDADGMKLPERWWFA